MTFKPTVKSPLAKLDRGPFGNFPEGTKSRMFFASDNDSNTTVSIVVYFLPTGKRMFSFLTPHISETPLAYSNTEVSLIYFIIGWISKHKDVLYPSEEFPDGQPLDVIDDLTPCNPKEEDNEKI
jgi:hypothetical protein